VSTGRELDIPFCILQVGNPTTPTVTYKQKTLDVRKSFRRCEGSDNSPDNSSDGVSPVVTRLAPWFLRPSAQD